jgi:glycopeptide antibiotics resistance protein
VVDAARNIALFAGFGAIWIVTARPEHPWRSVLRITLLGCALSVSIEVVQLLSASRISGINDVATNTIGALAGSLMIVLMTTFARRARTLHTFLGLPIFTIAGAYIAAVAAEMFSPLYRRDLNPGAGGSIFNRLMNALHYVRPVSPYAVSYFDMALFFPAGLLAVAALVELGLSYASACWIAIVGGAVLSVTVEVAHGIAGQAIELGAIAAHAVGIALGAVIGWAAIPVLTDRLRGRARAITLVSAYALLLTAWAWRPFEPRGSTREIAAQLSSDHLRPLGVLGATDDLFGVMDLAEQFFLYLPLGCLLAVWPLRRHGRLANLLPGIYIAVILEAGQLLVASRTFDVTDLITQCGALGVGFVVTRRAGYEVRGEMLEGVIWNQ